MSDAAVVPVQDIADIVQFGTFHHPDRFLQTAELVASAFKRRADKLELFKQIGPSKHLLVEGWQMLAAMYHVSAREESHQYVTFGDAYGFEATYVALHVPTQTVISRATAMCLNTEENWGLRPRYEGKGQNRKQVGFEPTPLQQILSMAQTRAESKVLSNLLKFVAKMAGYAVTPFEEMTGNEPHQGNGKSQAPQQKAPEQQQQGNGEPLISEAQRKRMWAIAKGVGLDNDAIIAILKRFGFERSEHVTKPKYEEVCSAIEQAGQGGQQ